MLSFLLCFLQHPVVHFVQSAGFALHHLSLPADLLGAALPRAALVWPSLTQGAVSHLQLPLWPATQGQGYYLGQSCLACLFTSTLTHSSLCICLFFSPPFDNHFPVHASAIFLHSQDLSQGPRHALHCERCCLLLVQWQFKGLMLWSFLERCWILFSTARRGISSTLPLKGSNLAGCLLRTDMK